MCLVCFSTADVMSMLNCVSISVLPLWIPMYVYMYVRVCVCHACRWICSAVVHGEKQTCFAVLFRARWAWSSWWLPHAFVFPSFSSTLAISPIPYRALSCSLLLSLAYLLRLTTQINVEIILVRVLSPRYPFSAAFL